MADPSLHASDAKKLPTTLFIYSTTGDPTNNTLVNDTLRNVGETGLLQRQDEVGTFGGGSATSETTTAVVRTTTESGNGKQQLQVFGMQTDGYTSPTKMLAGQKTSGNDNTGIVSSSQPENGNVASWPIWSFPQYPPQPSKNATPTSATAAGGREAAATEQREAVATGYNENASGGRSGLGGAVGGVGGSKVTDDGNIYLPSARLSIAGNEGEPSQPRLATTGRVGTPIALQGSSSSILSDFSVGSQDVVGLTADGGSQQLGSATSGSRSNSRLGGANSGGGAGNGETINGRTSRGPVTAERK